MNYPLPHPSPAGRMGWRKSGTKSEACRYVLKIKRNAFPISGNNFKSLVQVVFGHGVRGADVDDGGSENVPSSPCTFFFSLRDTPHPLIIDAVVSRVSSRLQVFSFFAAAKISTTRE